MSSKEEQMAKFELNRHFSEKQVQCPVSIWKKCPFLIIRDMRIKVYLYSISTHWEWLSSENKNQQMLFGKDVGVGEGSLFTADGNVN
jgi:hypothetical protein